MTKSFFDYSDKEQKEILTKAAKESNRMQKELVIKPQKTDKRWWEEELSKIIDGWDVTFLTTSYSDLESFISRVKQQTQEKYKGQTKRVWYSLGVKDGRKQILEEIKRKVDEVIIERMKKYANTKLSERKNAYDELYEAKSDIISILDKV